MSLPALRLPRTPLLWRAKLPLSRGCFTLLQGRQAGKGLHQRRCLGLAVPWGRKGHLSPNTLMQQCPSAPCPLAAKQELALDAPCPMGAGFMPTSPVSLVSTRLLPKLGIALSLLLGQG